MMETKNYRKGQVIFKAGDEGAEMYAVAKGRVGIYADYGGKREKLLARLEQDQTFGEMSLLEHAPRSATAVALEDTALLAVTEETLMSYFQSRPAEVLTVMQRMSENLRSLTKNYMNACRTLAEIEDAGRAGEVRGVKTS